jgi:hypothetical protein
MPLGLIARLRRYRRPAVTVAAGLFAVQAFLAGLATAQAGLVLTPNLADVAGFAVICHGNGGADSGNGVDPAKTDPAKTDPAKDRHPCCVSCAAGPPPATSPEQLSVLRADPFRVFKSHALHATSIPIVSRAVRAGPSQAPPNLD